MLHMDCSETEPKQCWTAYVQDHSLELYYATQREFRAQA